MGKEDNGGHWNPHLSYETKFCLFLNISCWSFVRAWYHTDVAGPEIINDIST